MRVSKLPPLLTLYATVMPRLSMNPVPPSGLSRLVSVIVVSKLPNVISALVHQSPGIVTIALSGGNPLFHLIPINQKENFKQ